MLDKIKWNSKPPSPQIKDEAALRAKTRHFSILDLGGGGKGGLGFPFILSKIAILDKIKWNSKPPSLLKRDDWGRVSHPPQIKDEAARRAKTGHFSILDLGGGEGGGSRFSIYFVQDCSSGVG